MTTTVPSYTQKTILRLGAFSLTLAIIGCATNVTMTGSSYPPRTPSEVKLIFKEKVVCKKPEELAFISTPYKWNQQGAIDSAREKAAEIGADYLFIQTVNSNFYNDVRVSGLAYKCLD